MFLIPGGYYDISGAFCEKPIGFSSKGLSAFNEEFLCGYSGFMPT